MPVPRDSLIPVSVDHREKGSGVPEALSAAPNLQVAFDHLHVGDYRIGRSLLFERKTIRDFSASLKDGRLFSQARKLAQSEALCAMILEGRASDLAGSAMKRESLLGAVISLELIFQIPLLRSLNPEETARSMIYALNQYQGKGRRMGRFRRKKLGAKSRAKLKFLQCLPGVGPVRAQALIRTFGSVRNVLTANIEELCGVDGIGQETAARIDWLLGEG